MDIRVSEKKPSLKYCVWGLLLAILSAFYSCCSIMAGLIGLLHQIFISGENMVGIEYFYIELYYIGAFVLTVITAVASSLLRKASIKRGIINKMTKASKIMNVLSIPISFVFTCVCFIVY